MKLAPDSVPIATIAPPSLVAALDAEVVRLRSIGVSTSRADVMRSWLALAHAHVLRSRAVVALTRWQRVKAWWRR